MANKIPVGQTIANAYGFAFGRFGTVLGVVWLPFALIAATVYFLTRKMSWPQHWLAPGASWSRSIGDAWNFDTSSGVGGSADITMANSIATSNPLDPQAAQFAADTFRVIPILELVIWVCVIVMAVGITRAALGIGGRTWVFFTLGKPFWRLLGANLIFYVLMIVAELAIFIPAVIVGLIGAALRDSVDINVLIAGAVALGIAAFGALYYVYFRLGYLIAPVVVAEQHIDLRRSWELAGGNIWRIVGVFLATTLPLAFLFYGIVGATFAYVFMQHPLDATSLPGFMSDHAAMFAVFSVASCVCFFFLMVLHLSAPAFAYRALVADRPSQTT